jgi:transporter family protein
MINPIILAIYSMLLTGSSDFLYRRARIQGASPEFFLFVQAIFFNSFNLIYIVFQRSLEISITTVFFGVCCGILVYTSVLLFLKSLSKGQASINVTIFRLSFIITAILAIIFIHEEATLGKFLAVSLAAFSIIALSKSLETKNMHYSVLIQLLFATFLYGLFGFIYKVAISTGSTPTGIVAMQGATFFTLSFITSKIKNSISISRSVLTHAPICGVLLVSSFLLLLESLKFGEVSVNFSIVQLSFVFTSILAIVFLGEKFKMLNFFGIAAAVLAVYSFAFL